MSRVTYCTTMSISPERAFNLFNGGDAEPVSWCPVGEHDAIGALVDLRTSSPQQGQKRDSGTPTEDLNRFSEGASPSTARKSSAVWDDRADAVYITGECVCSPMYSRQYSLDLSVLLNLPPMDRNLVRFYREKLARNELIASILTICTDRYWDRRQVSSHHQQLKSKSLPGPYNPCVFIVANR